MGHLLEQYVSSLSGLAINVPEKPLRHGKGCKGNHGGWRKVCSLILKYSLEDRQTEIMKLSKTRMGMRHETSVRCSWGLHIHIHPTAIHSSGLLP